MKRICRPHISISMYSPTRVSGCGASYNSVISWGGGVYIPHLSWPSNVDVKGGGKTSAGLFTVIPPVYAVLNVD